LRQGLKGVDLYKQLPASITGHPAYAFLATGGDCSSGNPAIRKFLAPVSGDRFLDLGCCVNIINHRLHEWPSAYYGVDVSPENIGLLKRHVAAKGIAVGGLHAGRIDRLSFTDGYFRIAACVGVLEYYPLEYAEAALREARRVLAPGGRFYVDIPNIGHPGFPAMQRIEEHMGRPIMLKIMGFEFEKHLDGLFAAEVVDLSRVMAGYFLRAV
jgi:SAM-dependent methyltransferase